MAISLGLQFPMPITTGDYQHSQSKVVIPHQYQLRSALLLHSVNETTHNHLALHWIYPKLTNLISFATPAKQRSDRNNLPDDKRSNRYRDLRQYSGFNTSTT